MNGLDKNKRKNSTKNKLRCGRDKKIKNNPFQKKRSL